MEYVLIDENNVIAEMFSGFTIDEIKELEEYKSNYTIEEKKDYMFKGLNLNRVVDDVVLSNKQAIDKGLIKLKENEILLSNDVIAELDSEHKVENGFIVEKSSDEKLSDGLISQEEYNKIQNEKREKEYEGKTDKQVIELIRNFLNKNKDSLSDEDKSILDRINSEIDTIKQEYPKQN